MSKLVQMEPLPISLIPLLGFVPQDLDKADGGVIVGSQRHHLSRSPKHRAILFEVPTLIDSPPLAVTHSFGEC